MTAHGGAIQGGMFVVYRLNDREDYYHAFLAGIFVGRGCEVESNKKRGLGRPDIKLTDHKNRRILIIEAKKSDSASLMEKNSGEALKQIIERHLISDDATVLVLLYPAATNHSQRESAMLITNSPPAEGCYFIFKLLVIIFIDHIFI